MYSRPAHLAPGICSPLLWRPGDVRPSGEGKIHVCFSNLLTELCPPLGIFFLLCWEIFESLKQVLQMLESVKTELVVNYILALIIMEEESLDTTDFI